MSARDEIRGYSDEVLASEIAKARAVQMAVTRRGSPKAVAAALERSRSLDTERRGRLARTGYMPDDCSDCQTLGRACGR